MLKVTSDIPEINPKRLREAMAWGKKFEALAEVRPTEYRHPCGVRYDLLTPSALEGMAKIMAAGAVKYGPDNWKKGLTGENSGINHAIKHIMEYQAGSPNDYGPRRAHLWQAMVNLMFEEHFAALAESDLTNAK